MQGDTVGYVVWQDSTEFDQLWIEHNADKIRQKNRFDKRQKIMDNSQVLFT